MENGSKRWGFRANKSLGSSSSITVRGVLNLLVDSLNKEDTREVVPLAHGDPSAFPCFRTTPVADEAVVDAVRSAKYNHYSPTVVLLPARRSVADYLNRDLPYKLSPDDVFLTLGCTQAIEITLTVLAQPGANILLPKPGFPYYEARAAHSHLEVRHFDLIPENGWEVDLDAVEALADENTVAMVIINPGNPCGSVYSYQHLQKGQSAKWIIRGNELLDETAATSIRSYLNMLYDQVDKDDQRPVVPLSHGDPSAFSCFRTSPEAVDAVVRAVQSAEFNSYAPINGILPARRAVAEYISADLPYNLSADDVYLTAGCTQSIEVILSVLARPGANILLPKPGYPLYESRAGFSKLEVRHFDLIPEKGWEVDLESVEALADENTAAIVIISPGNPCGNVFSYQHLNKVAETARKLGIFVIADEVYAHLAFGNNPYVPMGEFGSIVPVLSLGSISKRWIVPGWRFGWIAACDPNGILKKYGIVDSIKSYFNISTNPATFVQAAVPQIFEKTKDDFFSKIINIMREAADVFHEKTKEIPCVTCPHKPDGSMFAMVKLNLSLLEDISDDTDFCLKLAREESVTILPGVAVGLKNWLRITFSIEPESLEQGLDRMKAFCQRHSRK